METTEQRSLESMLDWSEDTPKALETPKPDFGAQLLTRRLQVQVLSPQPCRVFITQLNVPVYSRRVGILVMVVLHHLQGVSVIVMLSNLMLSYVQSADQIERKSAESSEHSRNSQ